MYNDQGEPVLSSVDKEQLEDALYIIKGTKYWKVFASEDADSSLAMACFRLEEAIESIHWI